MKTFEKLTPKRFIKDKLKRAFACFDLWTIRSKVRRLRRSNKRAIFLFMSPRYGNLGDQAIVLAELQTFADAGKADNVVEVFVETLLLIKDKLPGIITPPDIIAVTGGGFLGAIYPQSEGIIRELVIRTYRDNKIVVLPQTYFYPNTEESRRELELSRECYPGHKNLTVYARELNTYGFLRENFKGVNVKSAPDMVLSLKKSEPPLRRSGCLAILRSDIESVLSSEIRNAIIKFSAGGNIKLTFDDTCTKRFIPPGKRRREVGDFLNKIKRARFVVTDRLHGMIFCAITGTPCLALDNVSKKISGVYRDWLPDIENIVLYDGEESIPALLKRVSELAPRTYDNGRFVSLHREVMKNEFEFD
jgi:pyruvyl transferase EpsI